MRVSDITRRLSGLGGAKWDLHFAAQKRIAEGHPIIDLTIGEPDTAVPAAMIEHAVSALRAGRTGYSNGEGEDVLRAALARLYTKRRGREFSKNNVLYFPGTQAALFAVMQGVAEHGDDVLVGDPMYATYEAVVRASGANVVPVPLRSENGFRMQAADVEAAITSRTRAILLNSPHNPTGAILKEDDVRAIAAIARKHDLWIISDEVYEDLVFDGQRFVSPLSFADVADRVIAVSSISKSHAAPGFRSGWAIAPEAFCSAILPLSETMLFGGQPFIADMTARAVEDGSPVAQGMRSRFDARAGRLAETLRSRSELIVHRPQAGMFVLINASAYGLTGEEFAWKLLDDAGVAVMPGNSFGARLRDWVRVSMTVDDGLYDQAIERMHSLTSGLAC